MTPRNLIIIAISIIFPSSLWAMNCYDYNILGSNARSLEELHSQQITKPQIEVVKKNTALKASRVATLQYTQLALKLKSIMKDKIQLAELASGTSTLVRIDCYNNPKKDFYESVSEQFEFAVEHISNKNK